MTAHFSLDFKPGLVPVQTDFTLLQLTSLWTSNLTFCQYKRTLLYDSSLLFGLQTWPSASANGLYFMTAHFSLDFKPELSQCKRALLYDGSLLFGLQTWPSASANRLYFMTVYFSLDFKPNLPPVQTDFTL
jgi:hypothetical protein